MKKFYWVLLMALLLSVLPLAAQAAPSQGKKPFWRAEYYPNPGLVGYPALAISEDTLSHDWGLGSPALSVPPDHFSARWTSTRSFEKGVHLFILNVDDGARVWFNGDLILDAWTVGSRTNLRAEVYVDKAGEYEIQVAYFEDTGRASISLESLLLAGEDDIISAWRGEYFSNPDLSGEPNLVRQDALINFDWSTGSPAPVITRDNFSIRWTRTEYFLAGKYTFGVRHDDGMRILLDGKILYDSWCNQCARNKFFEFYLPQGPHVFIVEYYDHIGDAVAQVRLCGPNLC
jgi:hypothetical protein